MKKRVKIKLVPHDDNKQCQRHFNGNDKKAIPLKKKLNEQQQSH